MMNTGWVCFEDEAAKNAALFRAPTLARDAECVLLADWFEDLGIEPAPSNELVDRFFCEALPAPLHGERTLWKQAIADLRFAGVESEEHSDFLFSQLPQEPKFQLLHYLINKYFRDVGWDEQARIRSVLEEVRSLLIAPPADRLLFVHGPEPRVVFRELAEAFKQVEGVVDVKYRGAFEVADGKSRVSRASTPRPLLLQAPALQRMDRLADALTHRVSRGRTSEVFLDCDAGYREYLVWKLAKAGVKSIDFVANPKIESQSVADLSLNVLLTRIRKAAKMKLRRRLQLERRARRLVLTRASIGEWIAAYGQVFDDTEMEDVLAGKYDPTRASDGKHEDGSMVVVGLFPWTSQTRWSGGSFFFEQPSIALAPLSILTPDDKKELARLGFGAGGIQTGTGAPAPSGDHRPVLLLSESGMRRHAAGIAARAKRKTLTRSLHPLVGRVTSSQPLFGGLARPKKAPSVSATSARNYLDCPSRYFLQNVAGLYSDRDPRTDVQLYFGILAHKALELFFRPKMDAALPAITLPIAFERAFTETIREKSPWLRKEVLETLWNRIAGSVPKLEAQLDTTFGARSVYGIEFEFRVEWAGVVLRGRIDRVDRLGDGSLLLIDYKTGSVDFTPGHVAQGKDLQPWFYLRAVSNLSEPAAGILYYDLKGGEVCRGMILDKHLEKKNHKAFTRGHVVNEELFFKVLSEGEERVRTVAEGVLDARFGPTPSPSACQFCDFFLHCRSSAQLEGAAR